MQIRKIFKTSKPETEFDKTLESELISYSFELSKILNKGLEFSDNFNGKFITISDTGAADSENTLTHSLGRVPSGYFVTKINKASVGYLGSTAWTATNIYLKFNVANCAVTVFVF